ncbi:hypothetical protein PVAP13_1KG373500 [Panicum virgatum]|uniref:Uncharacterized protein n=1 Tax=Panicum virgatum TaxID=38727 RepID=A0A8T0XKC1_PANVG|nr:hypothetical protein PVAP13_1KG373500 [Panicum virgatum]
MMSSCRLGTETCHNQVSIALVDTISLKCSLVWNQVYIVCRCSCNWMVNTLHDMILCDLFKKMISCVMRLIG